MPQSHCTVGPSRRLWRTPDAEPKWTWDTRELNLVHIGMIRDNLGHPGCAGTLKNKFWNVQNFRGPSRIPPVFLLRDCTRKAPERYRDHWEGTGTTRESVFHYCAKPIDPGWPRWYRMLITVILDWPSSPRFTRVHHGSLGMGTVDQGVLLRQHSSRPRLAPRVHGWARQWPEASRCLAAGTPVVTLVQVVYGVSTVITEFLERGI